MDNLDTFVHPQAWAAALAVADLSVGWIIVTATVVGMIRERRRNGREATPSPSAARRHRFA